MADIVNIDARREARIDEFARLICAAFSRAETRIMEEARTRFGPSVEADVNEACNRARRAVTFLCVPAHLRVEAAAWEAKALELQKLADEIEAKGR